MRSHAKIWLIKSILILNAFILLGSYIGSAYTQTTTPVVEEAEQTDSSEDQSTGSVSFHFLSYKAIVPGFHFYIPMILAIVFEIESTTPYAVLVDEKDPLILKSFTKLLFGRIICPNAP